MRLQSFGIRKGDIIPLFMTNGAVRIVAILGALKAGAAYSPIAINLPFERIGLLLDEISAQHITCTPRQKSLLNSFPVHVLSYDIESLMTDLPERGSPAAKIREVVGEEGGVEPAPDDLAYILFTSGSSGRPKGVMVEHGSLATTIIENGRQLNYSVGTKTLSFAAYTFDMNVLEVFFDTRSRWLSIHTSYGPASRSP